MSRKLLAGTLLLGALGLGAIFGLDEEPQKWSRSVTEFRADPILDRTVRVSGYLVPGTLCKMPDRCEHRFQLSDLRLENPSVLPVRYRECGVPDTLRDVPGIETDVTVEGRLCAGCHVFEADLVMTRCNGTYQVPVDGKPPHGAYAALKTCEPNM